MNTRVHDRYEIGHPRDGLLETAMTVREAERIALARGPGHTLYDSLAHRGCWQVWVVDDTGKVLHAVERRK